MDRILAPASQTSYAADSRELVNALSDGETCLLFEAEGIVAERSVVLDGPVKPGALFSLRGLGAIGGTNIVRLYDGFPHFFYAVGPFFYEWDGFALQEDYKGGEEPTVKLGHVDRSSFRNIAAFGGRSTYFHLGFNGQQASAVKFLSCYLHGDGPARERLAMNGLVIENAVNILVDQLCHFERFRNAGIYLVGPRQGHESYPTRGLASQILNSHFEDCLHGIFLENVRGVRVSGNYFWAAPITLWSDSSFCEVSGNWFYQPDLYPPIRNFGQNNVIGPNYGVLSDGSMVRFSGEWGSA